MGREVADAMVGVAAETLANRARPVLSKLPYLLRTGKRDGSQVLEAHLLAATNLHVDPCQSPT
jgi:hypothetical protein